MTHCNSAIVNVCVAPVEFTDVGSKSPGLGRVRPESSGNSIRIGVCGGAVAESALLSELINHALTY
jgi:hypothetical protein